MRLLTIAVLCVACSGEDSEVSPTIEDTGIFDDTYFPPSDTSPLDTATTDTAPIVPDPPTVTKTFTEDDAAFLNPERGVFDGSGIALTDGASYEGIRTKGYTLAYAKVRLDAYRTTMIPKSTLDAL